MRPSARLRALLTPLRSAASRAVARLLSSVETTKTQATLRSLPFIVMAVVVLIDLASGPASGLFPCWRWAPPSPAWRAGRPAPP
nr:hypothetical protein GCM10020093_114060 [Planobispora longispora]